MNLLLTGTRQKSEGGKASFHNYPFWSPRFWHGMRLGDWLGFWAANGFRVHPLRVPMAFGICSVSTFNSCMSLVQKALYGRQIAETQLEQPPLFIVGHWRSGTTLLHELMSLDERFTSPTTYECFAPHHFLVTGWLIARYCGFLMPKQRPMDNMETGWDRPQEDEFGLLTLGAPSPYRRMAFPNQPPPDTEFVDMEGVDPAKLERWRATMRHFVRLLTFARNKQLVLKSPPHTGRIGVLSEMFPGARFVHIVRDPYVLFASTRRLWQSLDSVQGLQLPRHENLDEYIFQTLEQMYRGFEKQRSQIDPAHLCEVHYERLVEDPVGILRGVYEHLELGHFERVQPKLEAYAREHQNYRTNRYELDESLKQEIHRRWRGYFERYGYEA